MLINIATYAQYLVLYICSVCVMGRNEVEVEGLYPLCLLGALLNASSVICRFMQ